MANYGPPETMAQGPPLHSQSPATLIQDPEGTARGLIR
jgi:hypothetical protein